MSRAKTSRPLGKDVIWASGDKDNGGRMRLKQTDDTQAFLAGFSHGRWHAIWRPVTEKPTKDGKYLVAEKFMGVIQVYTTFFRNGGWTDTHIIAWTDLPDLPEFEDEQPNSKDRSSDDREDRFLKQIQEFEASYLKALDRAPEDSRLFWQGRLDGLRDAWKLWKRTTQEDA